MYGMNRHNNAKYQCNFTAALLLNVDTRSIHLNFHRLMPLHVIKVMVIAVMSDDNQRNCVDSRYSDYRMVVSYGQVHQHADFYRGSG